MSADEQPSREVLERIAKMRFPDASNRRLQALMDLNNDGRLSDDEREELAAYAKSSELLGLLRAQALKLLGRQPD